MKVVFVVNFSNPSASGLQRRWALEQCGVEVFTFNTHNYPSVFGKWAGHLAKVLQMPRLMQNSAALEKDLITFCADIRPDVIWYEWPKEIQPWVLAEIRKNTPKAFLISFQDDNPWGDRLRDQWMWRDYFKLIPYFDLHLVKRPSDIDNIKYLGGKNFKLWEHGVYAPYYHPPKKELYDKKYDVSFVGTCMDSRGAFISSLLEAGISIHVFGNLWKKRMGKLVERFPNNFHPAVLGKDYADVIRDSFISLLPVSNSNKDEWTMRSYEIPGCATAGLVCRTPTHEKMFENGKTAFFYDEEAECADIIMNILTQPKLALEVGKRAEKIFKQRGWMIENRMHNLLTELTNDKLIKYNPSA